MTLPLGGLALQDLSSKSLAKAEKITKEALAGVDLLKAGRGRDFYAVGGTWRSLTRLHMWQTGYPLHVMHGYVIPASEALEFSSLVRRVDPETLSKIEIVTSARRPLLAYAALVMENIVRRARPRRVVVSALGVREGLLYSLLSEQEQKRDALVAASQELNVLRSRSPEHGEELAAWTDQFMASSGIDETAEEKRLRRAACLFADIGWRAHPDYRGEQSLNIISHAAFVGVDHPGRAFIALAVFFRHVGLADDELSPHVRELATARMIDRARVLGAAMRVAYLVSGAMPAVLPACPASGGARQAQAEAARKASRSRRRAHLRAAAATGAPDRAGAGDRDGLITAVPRVNSKTMSKFGKDLIDSMKQAAAHAGGRKVPGKRVTTVEIPDVRAIRKALHMSQHRFASLYRIPLAILKKLGAGQALPRCTCRSISARHSTAT